MRLFFYSSLTFPSLYTTRSTHMTKSHCQGEDDDLEIISIGTLYSGGRWNNKYWSSSRGRDRHPYPVGYQAARTYKGLRVTMQILPGNTGPLFLITSGDGQTASAPTPHIAWKLFQRAPLFRTIRGKRLYPNIDGAQFFGFKHLAVQQLLRQLLIQASQGTQLSDAAQNTHFPNQSCIPSGSNDFPTYCTQDEGPHKRKMECVELTTDNPQKKVRPLKKRSLLRSYADGNICKNLNRSSTAATRDFTKPQPSTVSQELDDEKYCAPLKACKLDGVSFDPPLASPNVNLISSRIPSDAPRAESSPALLSQDGDILFYDPTNLSQNNDCDSAGEDITMSMMKLLLPQAVPLLRKACRRKKRTADYVDGMKNDSICQDHNKTKPALQSFKDLCPASNDSKLYEHKDLEEIPDVPDSCEELDGNAHVLDSCRELDSNAYVPDSCDELDDTGNTPDTCDDLDDNAHAPDSWDELDNNTCVPDCDAYVPDSCDEQDYNVYAADVCVELDNKAHVPDSSDELDENAQSLDFCEEVDDKEIIQNSPKQLNENHYISDSFDTLDENAQALDSCEEADDKEIVQDSPKQLSENQGASDSSDSLDENYIVPDSCDESDETGNFLSSTRLLTGVDVQDSNVQECEGKAVTCTLDGGKNIPTKSVDSNEGTEGTMDLKIFSEGGGYGTFFCEYEGNSNDKLKYQEQINLAAQQWVQNTNQNSHMGTAGVTTDILHCGLGPRPVISIGCKPGLDKCAFEANLKARSNKACASNNNLYETVAKLYGNGCSENNDGRCREATTMPGDMPHSTSVLHDKTPTCRSYDYAHFVGIQKPPASDMVTNGQCMVTSDANASSMSETLHLDHSAFVGNNEASVCRVHYPKLNVTKEPEQKLSGFGKLIDFPNRDMELLTRGKTLTSVSQILHHKQPALLDDSCTSTGVRAYDGHYQKVSMAAENENRASCFEKLDEFPFSEFTDDELLMCDKLANSVTETLHHKRITSVHDNKNPTGCNSFESENKLSGFGKLIGRYAHPKPVLSMLLCSKGSETYICTSCGTQQDNQRTLFMYKMNCEGVSAGRPFFVGHSPMLLPDSKCVFGRQIPFDKSGIQFTPNGPDLVLLNGMQLPSCRNGSMKCQCLECETQSRDQNAVKIVQLKDGYTTVLAKLKTVYRVLCLLVCEPNYLVAVEANGAFRFWTMNSTWRYATKEFILPPTDCISPCATELQQIPNCPHLVVGHNSLGEFGLWDVSRHTLLSRFFIPDTAVFRLVPLSLYHHNRKDNTFTCLNTKERPNSLKNTLPQLSSLHITNTKLNLFCEKDVVILILVAACPDIKSSYGPMPDGCWKLGMLMNNKVVLNHTLDARTLTVAASGDCGVLGMNQGYMYVWDLSTGRKLGASLCFKDGRIQCLYTDKTRSDLLAVTDDKGKLLLYLKDEESRRLETTYL